MELRLFPVNQSLLSCNAEIKVDIVWKKRQSTLDDIPQCAKEGLMIKLCGRRDSSTSGDRYHD